jgi:2'-5' RNA ligase
MGADVRQRLFVALIPPQPIQEYANEIKQQFADRYASRAAQKSPPHVTLQPPFEWSLSDLPQLEQQLGAFAATQVAIAIGLHGFAAFPPRVIYIDVERSPELLALQQGLAVWLQETLGIIDGRAAGRSFKPHMTVAFRDLTKQNFHLAWSEFQGRSLQLEWMATELSLLKHDGQRWQVHQNFPLAIAPHASHA